MKDLKYIIKRVIIGVAIVLILSFVNSCKVKALTTFDGFEVCDLPSGINEQDNAIYINVFDAANVRMVVTSDNNLKVTGNNVNSWQKGYNVYECEYRHYDSNSGQWVNDITNSTWVYKGTTTRYYANLRSESVFLDYLNTTEPGVNRPSSLEGGFYFNKNVLNQNNSVYLNYSAFSQYLPIQTPEFVSWNFHRNIQSAVVVSSSVNPEFSLFDTTNYTYQWKFGSNSSWSNLTENKEFLNFKNNGTIYVRVVDSQDNVVDSANFTITTNGKVASDYDYDITFSNTYSTSTSPGSSLGITVEEVKTDIEFIPENSLLRYQYKFVPVDEEPDNIIWTTSATPNISYNTTVNGTIYARITDTEYNQLYTETFTIPNIGKLGLGVGDTTNNENNFWTKISSKINYGGPVSSLFLIPVNALTKLYSTMSNSNICSPIQLGSLLGTNMQYDCINFKSIVGNDFYNIIDVIFAFVLSIGVFKFILKLYDNLISMREGVD